MEGKSNMEDQDLDGRVILKHLNPDIKLNKLRTVLNGEDLLQLK
jgi:hypothetical protein